MNTDTDTTVNIKPIYVIVCDDIRTETNGKQIFIGVYSGDIVVGDTPTTMNLSFWVDVKTEGIGQRAFEYKILLEPGDLEVAKIGATLVSSPDAERGSFAFGGISFQVQREGYLLIQFRQLGEEWQELERKKIIVNRHLSSSEQTPPS